MATNFPINPDYRDFDPAQDPAFLSRPRAHVTSTRAICWAAILTGFVVFWLALAIQWVIYDRFLHQDGLRFVGSGLAAAMAVVLVQHLKTSARNARLNDLRRLEAIALLNHYIRNSLQAITFASESDTSKIRESVDRIERVLSEVLPSVRHPDRAREGEPEA